MNSSDLTIIPSDIIRQKIVNFFVEKFKTKNIKISVEPGVKHGDNFIGIVYRVSGTNEENNEREKVFVKIAPTNPDRRKLVSCRGAFIREIFAYNEVKLMKTI